MKNYYKILEIDKNASDDIIKVAYKSLVKKYHPDLKEGIAKINAEEKIKQINEAYDILSNPEKKSEYDQNMINEDISKEQYEMLLNENINLKKELFYFKNSNSFNSNYYNQNNSNIYHNNTQNYNINNNIERKMFKEIVNTFISIIITLFIIIIVYHIPFVKQYVKSIFNNNFIFIIIIVFFSYLYFFRNRK